MLISHKLKKIFISIPKCGSTSIMTTLNFKSIHYKPNIYHASYNETLDLYSSLDKKILNEMTFSNLFYKKSPIDISDYYIYSIVRDPLDRLISIWKYFSKYPCDPKLKSEVSYDNINDFLINIISQKSIYNLSRHFWPYEFFLKGTKKGKLNLFSLENLDDCLENLLDKNSLNFTKFKIKNILNIKKKYRKTYDFDSNNISESVICDIKDIYSNDYALYKSVKLNNL